MQVHGFGGGGDTAMVVDIGEQGVDHVGPRIIKKKKYFYCRVEQVLQIDLVAQSQDHVVLEDVLVIENLPGLMLLGEGAELLGK